MALSAARRWLRGRTTTKGSLTRRRNAKSGGRLSPSKKGRIDFSFRKAVRKQRRVLTRYHHVDVRQLIAQDLHGLRHPRQFVPSKKAHCEAWLCRMSDPAYSFGCRFNL